MNNRQQLSICEIHVEYKSKPYVWNIGDLNPIFPINIKHTRYIEFIVWGHGWSVPNSNLRNVSIQRDAELYVSSRSAKTSGELREMFYQIGEMLAVLQVTAEVNMTRGNSE